MRSTAGMESAAISDLPHVANPTPTTDEHDQSAFGVIEPMRRNAVATSIRTRCATDRSKPESLRTIGLDPISTAQPDGALRTSRQRRSGRSRGRLAGDRVALRAHRLSLAQCLGQARLRETGVPAVDRRPPCTANESRPPAGAQNFAARQLGLGLAVIWFEQTGRPPSRYESDLRNRRPLVHGVRGSHRRYGASAVPQDQSLANARRRVPGPHQHAGTFGPRMAAPEEYRRRGLIDEQLWLDSMTNAQAVDEVRHDAFFSLPPVLGSAAHHGG